MDFDAPLPIDDALPALTSALRARNVAVLVAPPGAGKTTLVPLALLDAAWRGAGRIVVLEPRRVAARAAAARMASLLGEPTGQRVGYRTRLDSAVSAATRIEVVTEGLLVRRLQADPGLEGVAAVLFDEVHERSLDGDLALAFCLDLQRALRPELRLLAMSATADATRLAPLMDAAVLECTGRAHPVAVRHAARDFSDTRDLPRTLARAVRTALAGEQGDVLAFLPGMGEIRRAQAELEGCGAVLLPLHGELPPGEQDRALQPDPQGRRRVVLATSIAETSLTVPGVRVVVDGGFRRAPRLDAARGLTRLATLRISRAAAEQRAGRAGREAPGVAIRLWTQALHRGLPAFDRPEILEAELAGLVLDCAAWGASPTALAFADPPPPGAVAAARALLSQLGALDSDGRITEAGRRMARLGAHPRLAAMMLAAASPGEAELACRIAALLEERDPLRGRDAPADIGLRLAAIAGEATDADLAALRRIREGAGQYRRRLGIGAASKPSGDAGRLLAAGFPDRIAQRRGEPGSFRLAGGGGARLSPADPVARAGLLVAADLELRTSPRIALAAPLDAANLPETLRAQVAETVESAFDPASGAVLTRRRRRLGALVLGDNTEAADPATVAQTLAAALPLAQLPWTDAARQFQARVEIMRALEGDWPDLSDAALETNRDWLVPHLHGVRGRAELSRIDLLTALRGLLPHVRLRELEAALPTHLALPAGRRAAVDYTQPVPVAEARAQYFFGMAETPLLAGGRVPLRLALLSPAGRPAAVTGDLAQFWRGGWADMRREMRGRYPKHDWPEQPATATKRP